MAMATQVRDDGTFSSKTGRTVVTPSGNRVRQTDYYYNTINSNTPTGIDSRYLTTTTKKLPTVEPPVDPTPRTEAQTTALNSNWDALLNTLMAKIDGTLATNNSNYDKLKNLWLNSQRKQLREIDKKTEANGAYGNFFSDRNRIRANTNNALTNIEENRLNSENNIKGSVYDSALNLVNNVNANGGATDEFWSKYNKLVNKYNTVA